MQELQQQLQEEFQVRLAPVIQEVGREKGLHFIFNGPDSGLVWADAALDISRLTSIKKLDAAEARRGTPSPRCSERRHPPRPRPPPRPLSVAARRSRSSEHEAGKRLVAVKNVTVNEEYFQGHFPGAPLMPAVLMIEALAQVATLLIVEQRGGRPAGHVALRGVNHAKFRRQVVPGDRLRLEVTLGAKTGPLVRVQAPASVGGQVVAEAELLLVVLPRRRASVDPSAIVHPSARHRRRHRDRSIRRHRSARRARPRLQVGASAVIDGNTTDW